MTLGTYLWRAGSALILIGAGAAACSRSAPPADPPPPLSEAARAIASCNPAQDADPGIRVRKSRVAKGVFRGSHRLEVDGDLEQWETPYGRFWVVAENFDTFAEVLAEQAVEIYGDADRGVHAGDIVLDAGAHFGGFARTALNRGARLVVAIDIAPENLEVLRRNFKAEIAEGRVIVYGKGVWDKDDTMVLERKNHTWADHVVSTGAGPTVAVTTIDKIVAELKLPAVDFIKMDIEGAERQALAGAAGTLRSARPRLAIASYHEPDDLDVIPPIVLAAQPAYSHCVSGRELGHGYTTLFFR